MFDVYSRWSKMQICGGSRERERELNRQNQCKCSYTHTNTCAHMYIRSNISCGSCAKFIDELFTCFSWAIFLWRREYVDALALSLVLPLFAPERFVIKCFLCIHSHATVVSVSLYVDISVLLILESAIFFHFFLLLWFCFVYIFYANCMQHSLNLKIYITETASKCALSEKTCYWNAYVYRTGKRTKQQQQQQEQKMNETSEPNFSLMYSKDLCSWSTLAIFSSNIFSA